MKLIGTKLFLFASLLCISAAIKPLQSDTVSFTVKDSYNLGAGTPVNFNFLVKGEVYKNYKGLETIKIEAYENSDKTRRIFIEVSAEEGKHLGPGNYKYGDKEDFYGTYPVNIWFYDTKDGLEAHGTQDNAKAHLIIKSVKNGRISGSFSARLQHELALKDVIIENGIFDLAYTTKK